MGNLFYLDESIKKSYSPLFINCSVVEFHTQISFCTSVLVFQIKSWGIFSPKTSCYVAAQISEICIDTSFHTTYFSSIWMFVSGEHKNVSQMLGSRMRLRTRLESSIGILEMFTLLSIRNIDRIKPYRVLTQISGEW